MSSKLLNKAITSCFAKIARVDGSIGKEEIDIINSSKILNKYKYQDVETINTKNFFNKIQTEYGKIIKEKLKKKEKDDFITELVNLIKADNKVHEHEFFLLGHIANSIGINPQEVANIINNIG